MKSVTKNDTKVYAGIMLAGGFASAFDYTHGYGLFGPAMVLCLTVLVVAAYLDMRADMIAVFDPK